MLPGPANVLSCPFCGGAKEVMTLLSGNTFGATVWSDTRRYYPMLPEVSPIQQCPHCSRYYFTEEAKQEHNSLNESFELGKLNFSQLKEARQQMEHLSIDKAQRWMLNHQLFMAYNDCYRRDPEKAASRPGDEDEMLFQTIVGELLDGIGRTEDYDLFHAELLRETGRFDEARAILANHSVEDDKWVIDAMLRHIDDKDQLPFLLISNGELVKD